MRNQMHLTTPLIIACAALLLCIGVIAGLTGALVMQASTAGRSGPVAATGVLPPANTASVANQPLAMGNALVPATVAAGPVATDTPVAAAVQAPPQDAGIATPPPAQPAPTAEAIQPPAALSQAPAAPTQEAPLIGAVTSAAEAQGDEVDPATFQEDLQPMGQWVTTPDYGACWAPRGVPIGWRPYSEGRWVYTECGWTWFSDEPWGMITYHYGSWVDYPTHGWIWVPGRVWAPAWVAWRVGGGYVGWAPLPPSACRRDFVVADALVLRIPSVYFCFVGERDFGDEHIGRRMRPAHQNVTIIVQTRNSTHIEFGRGGVVNRSLSIEQVERMTGRRPSEVHLQRSDNRADAEQRRGRGEPVAYHPRPQPAPTPRGPFEAPRDGHQAPPPRAETSRTPLPAPPRVLPGGHDAPQPPFAKPPVITPPGVPTPPVRIPAPPLPIPRAPVVQPINRTPPTAAQPPVVKPPKVGKIQDNGGKPLPMPPADENKPAADKPKAPVVRPVGPEPRKPDPQMTPGGQKQSGSPSEGKQLPPPTVRPAGPEPRPANPQPAPQPTRNRGNSESPSADRPTPPAAVRPVDPPQRRADPEPTPAPEKRRERAPEQASPPAARQADPPQRRADPAPAREAAPARPQQSEAPQRRQAASADNSDNAATPDRSTDNAGRGGSRRNGR